RGGARDRRQGRDARCDHRCRAGCEEAGIAAMAYEQPTAETLPIREVDGLTTVDVIGNTVPTLPVRYVSAPVAIDEIGRPVDALRAALVGELVSVNSAGQVEPVSPVRVVNGLTTTDETGRVVPVVPVYLGYDPSATALFAAMAVEPSPERK